MIEDTVVTASPDAVAREEPRWPSLRAFVEQSHMRSVIVGTSKDPNAKITILLLPVDGDRPALAVKVPTTDLAARAVEREGRMLVELRRRCRRSLLSSIPRVVDLLEFNGRTALVATAMPGVPMSTAYLGTQLGAGPSLPTLRSRLGGSPRFRMKQLGIRGSLRWAKTPPGFWPTGTPTTRRPPRASGNWSRFASGYERIGPHARPSTGIFGLGTCSPSAVASRASSTGSSASRRASQSETWCDSLSCTRSTWIGTRSSVVPWQVTGGSADPRGGRGSFTPSMGPGGSPIWSAGSFRPGCTVLGLRQDRGVTRLLRAWPRWQRPRTTGSSGGTISSSFTD